jgi:hypothetical protein
VRALFLPPVGIGCVVLESVKSICDRSILDCELPESDDLSEDERGMSPPELEVQALNCKHAVRAGLVNLNTGTEQSIQQISNAASSKT